MNTNPMTYLNQFKLLTIIQKQTLFKKCTPDTCTIMSMNCQILGLKFDDIKLLLNSFEQYEKLIQVLCLQETWIEDADF